MKKISFITTILNEQDSVLPFLESLANQTRLPGEIIITDAGSIDQTLSLIEQFKANHPTLMIRIIRVPGINRSQGRNQAIQKAHYSIIAASDAGCILKPDWLEKITAPILTDQAQVVAGAYLPATGTTIEKISAVLSSVFPDQIPKNFLPSSRSIAFTKSTWKKIGGYPEHLNTAEDLVFANRLKRASFKIFVQSQALVHWQPANNLPQLIKQFYCYSHGDGLAGKASPHFRHYLFKLAVLLLAILWLFYRPLIAVISIIILTFTLAIRKAIAHRRYLQSFPAQLLFVPLSLFVSLTTIFGFIIGSVTKIFKNP